MLFAHDHRFRSDGQGRVWTTGALSASIWERYLKVFDHVHVAGRRDGGEKGSDGFARSDARRVSFTFLDNLSSPAAMLRRGYVRHQIEKLVAQSDAVVARVPSEFGLTACAAARKLKKPYLVEVVGSAFDAYTHHGTWIGKAYARLAERRVRAAVAKAPFVIYVTEKWLQSQYPSEHPDVGNSQGGELKGLQAGATDAVLTMDVGEQTAASVTNAVVVVPGREVKAARERRLRSLAAGRQPVLGTIGSLATSQKGIQVALPALAELRREGFAFTYRILGGGNPEPWQKLIEQHALSDCCHLDGVLPPGTAVLEWLDSIDIYLQPSLQEGLPRAVLEAMSRGLPCLGSSAGGIPELVYPDYIHKPGDARQLAEHLRKLLSSPGEVARLSALSSERVLGYAPEIVEAKRQAMLRALRQKAEFLQGHG